MALRNKTITVTASLAGIESVKFTRVSFNSQPRIQCEAHGAVTRSDGSVDSGSVLFLLQPGSQLETQILSAMDNALLRTWRLDRGLED